MLSKRKKKSWSSRPPRAKILECSGFSLTPFHKSIQPLRAGFYRNVETAIVGDAPKDFLRVYEYGNGRKANPKKWPGYIAKVGQKWYPNESITEHLLTRIGQALGLRIAESRLMLVRGQLRFLSKYFLKPDESLVHGAEIFASYLNDKNFVEEVEERKESRNVFTFQFVEQAVENRFPQEAAQILEDFVKLLAFDTLVGNNDRHFYNWGVIIDVHGKKHPQFSPIYDTARALFWNEPEGKLQETASSNDLSRRNSFMQKYVEKCLPKTGWDNVKNPNHFELMVKIFAERPNYREALGTLDSTTIIDDVKGMFLGEFSGLFSKHRQEFILDCLLQRLNGYRKAIQI